MISSEHLQLITQLRFEPGYVLLCDHLQAFVDDLADEMAADGPSDLRLQKLNEWTAARKILTILKTYPESLARDNDEDQPKHKTPEELTIDPVYLARLKHSGFPSDES